MENIFNQEFWIQEWEKDKTSDTYAVHMGFSAPAYWDKASATYNKSKKEVRDRKLERTLKAFRDKGLLFKGVKVLDIGCGTGLLSIALAKEGAEIIALDFSKGMLDRFKKDMPKGIGDRISLVEADWHDIDVKEKGWEKQFDLVIAFMSPGVATSNAFFKMMACARTACAIRGWAARRHHPIMTDLWKKIMDRPLDDKPQSILYKINLLFSMGLFPDIGFDLVEWDQTVTLDQEFDNQLAFFSKVSDLPQTRLESIIRDYLSSVARGGSIRKKQKGLTATAIFSADPLI